MWVGSTGERYLHGRSRKLCLFTRQPVLKILLIEYPSLNLMEGSAQFRCHVSNPCFTSAELDFGQMTWTRNRGVARIFPIWG